MPNGYSPILDRVSPKGFEGYENRKPKGGGHYRADYSSRLNFLLQLKDRKGFAILIYIFCSQLNHIYPEE